MFVNPVAFAAVKAGKALYEHFTDEFSDSKIIQQLTEESQKKDLQMQMAETEAKVLQEIAIAQRIQIADQVEIEEYYDTEGQGKVGVDVKNGNCSVGTSGSGKRVSKRIFKFNGVNTELLAALSSGSIKSVDDIAKNNQSE